MKEFYPSFATDLFFKDQPLKIDVHWRNVGRSVAENPFPYAKVYLVPDASNANQLKLIDQFDGEYLGVIKNNPKWETTPVLPYNPAIPETVYTAQGQNVSDEDLKKIHSAQAAVFVIGAVRYKDNLGTHDAHACAYLTGIQRLGTRVDLRWQDCLSYVTPVEVR